MKIILLQDDFPPESYGGAGIVTYNLARAFSASGHDVLVVTATQDKGRAGRAMHKGVSVERIYSAYHDRWYAWWSLYNPVTVKRVKEVISKFKPDIVHAHNVHSNLSYYSLVVARKYARRVYMTAHDAMSFRLGKFTQGKELSVWEQFRLHKWRYNPFRTIVIRHILKRNVDTVIAVSEALKRALSEHEIPNVVVIHNGIDAHAWERPVEIESFKNKYAIGNSAILFGGRLSGAKGAIAIVDALDSIRESVPEVQLLVIAKKEDYAERVIAHARDLGIAERLIFTGWISGNELRQAYYASSVVAVPSLYLDPFPTINLEAMASHKSVVATCFGGSPEIVQDGVTGYVVNPTNVPAMAAKIGDMLIDTQKNTRFGNAGHERVVQEFSLAKQVKDYEKLFALEKNGDSFAEKIPE